MKHIRPEDPPQKRPTYQSPASARKGFRARKAKREGEEATDRSKMKAA